MVTYFEDPRIAKALSSDDPFLDLLKSDAGPGLSLEDSPHPDEQTLMDYAQGLLDEDQMNMVLDHVAVCRRCARDAMVLCREHEEMMEELLKWSDRDPTD